jgi:predicted MFS family arabinose efflux permease
VGVTAADLPTLWAPVLAGIATAAAAPYPSCTAASIPRLVPDADLPAANAARAVLGPLCIVVGPALGSLLLLAGPVGLVFLVNAGTFLVSALAVASLRASDAFAAPKVAERNHLLAQMRQGARALWENRLAMQLVSADLICSFLYGVETVVLMLVSARLGMSTQGYGLLLAMIGAGGVLGSMLAARVARVAQVPTVIAVLLVLSAVPLAVLPLTSSLTIGLLITSVMGTSSMLVEILTETILQRSLDEAVFGRAYGFAFPASIGGIAIGAAIAGPLVAWFGLATAMLLIAAAVTAYAATLARSSHGHRRKGISATAPQPAAPSQ